MWIDEKPMRVYHEVMTIFYTSDLHFSHRNKRGTGIIDYCNRPFSDIDEMDAELIRRWNSRVSPADTGYILGDVAFCRPEKAAALLDQMNGELHLIAGNHDPDTIKNLARWKSVQDYLEIYDRNKKIIMLHYCMKVWNKSHRGSLHLFGHSHGSMAGTSQSLDVGVDCWDYYPVTLPEIMARMATLPPYRSGDHHV